MTVDYGGEEGAHETSGKWLELQLRSVHILSKNYKSIVEGLVVVAPLAGMFFSIFLFDFLVFLLLLCNCFALFYFVILLFIFHTSLQFCPSSLCICLCFDG